MREEEERKGEVVKEEGRWSERGKRKREREEGRKGDRTRRRSEERYTFGGGSTLRHSPRQACQRGASCRKLKRAHSTPGESTVSAAGTKTDSST